MTEEEVQRLIDRAIAKHNRNATIISACLGFTVLAFYSHGLVTVVNLLAK
jgi:hypothetical protein